MFHPFWHFWSLSSMPDLQLEMLPSLGLHSTLVSHLFITPFLFPSLFLVRLLPTKYVACLRVGTLTKTWILTKYWKSLSNGQSLTPMPTFPLSTVFCHGNPILFHLYRNMSEIFICNFGVYTEPCFFCLKDCDISKWMVSWVLKISIFSPLSPHPAPPLFPNSNFAIYPITQI